MTPLARLIAAVEGAHEQPVYRLTEHAVIKAAEDIWFASDDQHLVRVLADAVNGSLDAAVAFKEAVLPGWEWRLTQEGDRVCYARVGLNIGPGERKEGLASSTTPSLALVVAVLKALVAKEVSP
jgi:hypothetical protein